MSDVHNLVEVVNLVCDGVNVGLKLEEPGHKISWADLSLIGTVLPDLLPAIKDIGQVPSELAAMTPEDAAVVVGAVAAKLAITDEHAKAVVGAVLQLLTHLVPDGINLANAIKHAPTVGSA